MCPSARSAMVTCWTATGERSRHRPPTSGRRRRRSRLWLAHMKTMMKRWSSRPEAPSCAIPGRRRGGSARRPLEPRRRRDAGARGLPDGRVWSRPTRMPLSRSLVGPPLPARWRGPRLRCAGVSSSSTWSASITSRRQPRRPPPGGLPRRPHHVRYGPWIGVGAGPVDHRDAVPVVVDHFSIY